MREMGAAGGLAPCFDEALVRSNGGGRIPKQQEAQVFWFWIRRKGIPPITMLSVIRTNESALCFLHG
jgi:hypothetical protein